VKLNSLIQKFQKLERGDKSPPLKRSELRASSEEARRSGSDADKPRKSADGKEGQDCQ